MCRNGVTSASMRGDIIFNHAAYFENGMSREAVPLDKLQAMRSCREKPVFVS